MKKRIISFIITGIMAVTICPGIQVEASTKKEIVAGDVVNVTKAEEEFEINILEEGIYTIYSNVTATDNSQLRISIYNESYNIITSSNKNIDLNLKPGKYFAKIESVSGMPLDCEFGVLGQLKFNDIEKIDSKSNVSMYKIDNKSMISDTTFIIESCENKDENEDTKITLYNDKLEVVSSNDDISTECKYSRMIIEPKAEWEMLEGKEYYVKVESKDNGPLSAVLAFTEDNGRHGIYTEFISPEGGGYYLMGEDVTLKAYSSTNTKDVNLEYRGLKNDNVSKSSILGEMKKDEKSNTYKIMIKPKREDFAFAFKSGKEYLSPNFVAVATKWNNSKIEVNLDGYITYYDRESYKNMDHSWYYNSPFENSFKGYGTDGYNCMAYGLGITDQYIWPWSPQATGIDYEAVCGFFEKKWSHKDRDGYKYTEFSKDKMVNAQAIYYEGHVAVVTGWDKDGMPTKIVSKWGGNELIESDLDGLVRWGDPLIYMKGRVDE